MQYFELDIRLKEVSLFADILVAKLNEIEFESYIEDENGLKAYIQTKRLNNGAVKDIMSEVSEQTELSYRINKVKEENWNLKWESNYNPVFVNKSCVIRAQFHNSFPEIKHEIIITPKMSFGTGHHETTLLMMNEMFSLDFKNKSVLDMGSGTGVLAILASKLGARKLIGIDNDHWSFNNAKENSKLNNISNVHFILGNVNSIKNSKFDIILANINRNVILNDIEIYVNAMNVSADIFLSGFLEEDISLVLNKSNELGLKLIVSKNKNKWQMLHLKKD
tara:strand:+ start:16094 stop:16927 length:834 start_codon:yes stop_codon:yes gene_type:complete